MKSKSTKLVLMLGILLVSNIHFVRAKNNPLQVNKKANVNKPGYQVMPGQIRIKFKPFVATLDMAPEGSSTTGIFSLDNKLIKNGVTSIKKSFIHNPTKDRFDNSGISRIHTLHFSTDKDVLSVAREFAQSDLIEYAEPIPVYYLDTTPNDPQFSQQDHLPQIKAPEAWDVVQGDSKVIIAILDSGTDWEHPDLRDNIWSNEAEMNGTPGVDDDGNGFVDDFHGWDFANKDNNPTNQPSNIHPYQHGTVTAGLASARTNNSQMVSGVAWNCTIMPLKHGMDNVDNAIYKWELGAVYAVENGAHIINASFGGFHPPFQADQDVINYAFENGVLFVASAGNVLTSGMHYPSAYDHVLGVTWVYPNDAIAWSATYGVAVDVAAPGVELLSLLPGNQTTRMSGSSSAAPVVAGLAGLIKSQHPDWGPYQIARQIVLTADNIDHINPAYAGELGSGRINAFRAVSDVNPPEISPKIKTLKLTISDATGGDGDLIFERGENIEVNILEMHNYSLSPGQGLFVTLTTNDTDLTVLNGEHEIGFFASDTTISIDEAFTFSVNEDAKGKTSKIMVGWHTAGEFAGADTFNIIVGKLPILVVDDDRGDFPAEKLYTNILDSWGTNYGVWNRITNGPLSPNHLSNFPIVIWLCEWAFPSLDSLDQHALSHFLDNGGNLFISGQDIGWDFNDPSGYGYDHKQFYTNYLHANYFADTSPVNDVIGIPNDPIGSNLQFRAYQPGLPVDNQYPDEIGPAEGATSCFEYLGGQNHNFGIKYEGDHKVVYFGMGLEAIDALETTAPDDMSPIRTEVMSRVLNWLNIIDFTPVTSSENLSDSKPVAVKIPGSFPEAEIFGINLFWKKENDVDFKKIVMTKDGSGEYNAEIPGPNEITNVQYYFELVNTYYEWNSPTDAPNKLHSYYIGPDNTPPAFNHTPLTSIINGTVEREFIVGIDDNSQIDPKAAYVHFSTESLADSTKLSVTNNPLQFRGVIPAVFSYGDTVQYFISAFDLANSPNRGVSETYTFVVGLEDFESGIGNWITTPNGWGLVELYPHSGTHSINDSPGQAPYPSNRYAILMSNFGFDLSNCSNATLKFWTKHYIELNSDYGYVEVSNDGGAAWQQIGVAFNGFSTKHIEQTLSLNDFCGAGNSNVKLRFRFVSDAQTLPPFAGWFIDDIQVIEGKNVSQVTKANVSIVPDKYALHQNYPNPFNPRTTIRFELPESEQVTLTIFNIRGEIIRTLVDKQLSAGTHKIEWNGKDNFQMPITTGVYFYRLSTANFNSVKKLIFLK